MNGIPVFPEGSFKGRRGWTRPLLILCPLVALGACVSSGGYVADGSAQTIAPGGRNGGTGGNGPDGGIGPMDGSVVPGSGGATPGSGGATSDGSAQDKSGGMDSQQADTGAGMDSQPVDMGGTDRVSMDSPPPMNCGNGKVDTGEDCDGTNLNGRSCSSLGFTGGVLACAASCLLNTSACTSGAVTPKINITASRTVCAAPCAVFFDATGTSGLMGDDYVGANFNWDFDSTNADPSGRHRKTIGFATAHVFENPGTYQVAVRVRDMAGNSASSTVQVTVSPMSGGSTFYVAQSGSDSNPGTMDQPFSSAAKGFSKATTNNSVLFHRGDTFPVTGTLSLAGQAGPIVIGAYGDSSAAPPILNSSGAFGSVVVDKGSSDIRFMDLHIVQNGSGTGGISIGDNTAATNILGLRVETEGGMAGSPQFYSSSNSDGVFIVDCHAHSFNGYGYFAASPKRDAVVGTTIDNYGQDHGIRTQGCTETSPGVCDSGDHGGSLIYIAEDTINGNLTGGNPPFASVSIRGDNDKTVFVNNSLNLLMGVTPQNTASVELITNVLVEGNLFKTIELSAQHVVVRNNAFYDTQYSVVVKGSSQLPAGFVDQILVANNTAQYVGSGVPGFTAFLEHNATTGNVTVRNNIFYDGHLHDNNGNSTFISKDGRGTETEDHNLLYAPNDSTVPHLSGTGDLYGDPLFMSVDPTKPNAFRLSTGSPAIGTGTAVPIYQDFSGSARPAGSAIDIGAFQFQP